MKKIRIYIDEAWRWPLAWPVYTGLVLILDKFWKTQYKSSKDISEKQRDLLFEEIKELEKKWKILYSVWIATNKEIDKYWISKAQNIAISRWLIDLFLVYYEKILKPELEDNNWENILLDSEIQKILWKNKLSHTDLKKFIKLIPWFDWIFLDWNRDFWLRKDLWINIKTIIKWDEKVPEISMASIIAKVQRDEFMTNLPKKYLKYDFKKHKWYWTQQHRDLIKKYWISNLHRKCYLKNLFPDIKLLKRQTKIDILKEINFKEKKKKILLHVCCTPDLTWPLEILENFDINVLWYNPNINNTKEHEKRLDAFKKLLRIKKNKIIKTDYNPKEFYDFLYENQDKIWMNIQNRTEFLEKIWKIPETWKRCELCYFFRLLETAKIAQEHNIKYFSTTLSISPKKDLKKLEKYWKLANELYPKTKFILFDFKKNQGYKKSCELTKQYWLYRQNYCWCNWSKNN